MLRTPINPSDLLVVHGESGTLPTLPATPGLEGVGVVDAAGPGLLGKFYVGKRRRPGSQTGSWGEYAITTAKQAIPISSRVPLDQAAMFFVNPATAYIMTRRVLNVPPGEWLLQTAAGSALGKMVIRLGRRFGFKTVNVVRRREQAEELKALGADAVVVEVDGDVTQQVLNATKGQGVPYAIDPVAARPVLRS